MFDKRFIDSISAAAAREWGERLIHLGRELRRRRKRQIARLMLRRKIVRMRLRGEYPAAIGCRLRLHHIVVYGYLRQARAFAKSDDLQIVDVRLTREIRRLRNRW